MGKKQAGSAENSGDFSAGQIEKNTNLYTHFVLVRGSTPNNNIHEHSHRLLPNLWR